MKIDTSITLNSDPNTTKGIKFSDAAFLETAFNDKLNRSKEAFADGPTIEIELGSIDSGLKINSISTTYNFAPGISISGDLEKIQNSSTINNLYESTKPSQIDSSDEGITITIKPDGTISATTGDSKESSDIDLTPSSVDFKNIKGDVFDVTKPKPSKNEIFKMIDKIAPKYDMDPSLVKAVVQAESTFNNQCISHSGAVGLMQLMPVTAREMGLVVNDKVDERWDPEKNLEAGIAYISKYHKIISKYFGKEDWNLTLAGYNAGPNRVMQSGGIPDIKETKDYVQKVNKFWKNYK